MKPKKNVLFKCRGSYTNFAQYSSVFLECANENNPDSKECNHFSKTKQNKNVKLSLKLVFLQSLCIHYSEFSLVLS